MVTDDNWIEEIDTAIDREAFAKAEVLLAKLNADPTRRNLSTLLKHGWVLEAQRKFGEAAAVFEAAEAHATVVADKVAILNRVSDLLYVHNEDAITRDIIERMAALLERSVSLDSTLRNAPAILKLCNIYESLKNPRRLETQAVRLLAISDYVLDARLWLATATFQLGDRDRGLAQLRQVVERAGDLREQQIYRLIGLLVQYRAYAEAERMIAHARARKFENEVLLEKEIQIEFERGAFAKVLERLSNENPEALVSADAARRLYYYRARSLEAAQDYSGAHADFSAMNEVARVGYTGSPAAGSLRAYDEIPLDELRLVRDESVGAYTRVFMIAFPRSGTTLLETIIDTQPAIVTLSEVDAVTEVREKIRQLGKSYPTDLAAMTDADIELLRETYAGAVAPWLDGEEEFSMVVDKLPLNIVHVPLIRRLFPDAKFILSLRHPYDVCLSCFQQDFILNDQMVHFTTLEGCFSRYREVMSLFEQYRARLALDLHIVRYEDLVADLDRVATTLFTFLGIDSDQSYREFHTINQQKLVATPSRTQVTQPLYDSSRYRWVNYAGILEPYTRHVDRFLDLYGYSSRAKHGG